jgi:hypothetical protein
MSGTTEPQGNEHQNTPSADDLSAQIAADEAARVAPAEVEAEPEVKVEAEPEPEHVQDPESDDHAKRIERLAYERREARRQVKELQDRLARLENPDAATEETEDQRIERRAAQMAASQAYAEKANSIYKDGVKEFADFEQRMVPLREIGLSPAFVEAAAEFGDPHKLLHYLGKNVDEAEHVMTLPVHKMGAALAKIAVKLTAPPKQASRAPAPINPLRGSGKADPSGEDMPLDQYMRQEDERWANRRR